MVKIIQKNNPLLRKIAERVNPEDISSGKIKKIISDMKLALHRECDGVAIAAPQIGVLLRIFVVSGIVNSRSQSSPINLSDNSLPETADKDLIFINPEIIKVSKEKKLMEEGCLSVRPLYGLVKRSLRATVRAYDENGREFERGASGLMAQIFQHETDHLNGILFVDKAVDINAISEEEIREMK